MNDQYTIKPKCNYKHIVVVHGIGDQAPNETALRFMSELLRVMKESSQNLSIEVKNLVESVDDIKEAKADTAFVMPAESPDPAKIVVIEKDKKALTRSFTPAFVVINNNNTTDVLSFSEVYWKQIPDEFIKNNSNNLPIPIFTWAHSINTRFLANNGKATQQQTYKERESEFSGWALAIDNLEKIMKYLKSFARLIKKENQFYMFTERFLGDVQMYAESEGIKQDIDNRFLDVMSRIERFSYNAKKSLNEQGSNISKFDSTEIYIVAHSEGTVISYCCLVQAAIKQMNWLKNVKGLLTIGSPLDKHFTIWRNRFRKSEFENKLNKLPEGMSQIPWFNYWDKNDPIGYGLRALFEPEGTTPEAPTDANKLFDVKVDKGFRRYFIPLVAHNAYWKDKEIYKVIAKDMMGFPADTAGRTEEKIKDKIKDKSWGRFHAFFEIVGYFAIRAFLLAGLAFFLSKLLWPVLTSSFKTSWMADDSLLRFVPKGASHAKLLLWCLIFFFIGSVVCWLLDYIHYRVQTDGEGQYDWVYWLRKIFMIALVLGTTFICMANLPWFRPSDFNSVKFVVKDAIGYLTSGFMFFLLWKIHTSVFRVQIQLRKYIKGEDTELPQEFY